MCLYLTNGLHKNERESSGLFVLYRSVLTNLYLRISFQPKEEVLKPAPLQVGEC